MGSSLLIDGINSFSLIGWELPGGLPLLLGETSSLSRLAGILWVTLQVGLGIGFVIFVHELGHFLAAKTFGVRCDKFYVGFDVPISIGPIKLPRTLGKFQWGETEYGIGIIPLGGYVKMLGQDDDPRKAEEEAAKTRLGEGEDAPLDPRSYPAKPVWQRMIIISAGVIMNLIFAVILAGAAYFVGVPYTPTVVGSTYAGGPAWQAGILPGDQVLSVGNSEEESEKLRYDDFTTEVVSHGFEFKDGPLPLVLQRDGQRIETVALPTQRYHPEGYYLVGLAPPTTPTVASPPFATDSYLSSSKPDLQPGDVVVAVDGENLPVNERFGEVVGSELTSRLQAKWEEPVKITVERTSGKEGESDQRLDVVLPPVPVKSMGIGFEVGSVTAIQKDSLAEAAGIQVGDRILRVNGDEVTNALELPSMVGRMGGKELRLTLARPPSEGTAENTIEITIPEAPIARFDPISPYAGELSLGGIGVAFEVSPVIKSLDESLAESGLKIGDQLMQVHWIVDAANQKELSQQFREDSFEPLVIDRAFTVACLYDLLQGMPEGAELRCIVRRDGKMSEPVQLKTYYADHWFWHQRGIALSQLMDTYKADGLVSAVQLGFWETSRRFSGVLNFLKLLVTGRIGVNGLGGPGRIAYVAAAEASYGPSRLMIFLTMLSANLAILNFLPIPALDGGHMVFLTAEAIRGKPVSEALQVRLTMLGVLGLLSLMAFVIVKDIMWFAN